MSIWNCWWQDAFGRKNLVMQNLCTLNMQKECQAIETLIKQLQSQWTGHLNRVLAILKSETHNCSKPLVLYNYRSWDWDWDWGGRVCVWCTWSVDWKCDVAGGSSVGNFFSHRHGNTWFVVELLLRPTVGQHGWVTWHLWPATCISILPMLFFLMDSRMLPSTNYIKRSYFNEFSRLNSPNFPN